MNLSTREAMMVEEMKHLFSFSNSGILQVIKKFLKQFRKNLRKNWITYARALSISLIQMLGAILTLKFGKHYQNVFHSPKK
jgi:hypothetical protein